MNTIRRFHRPYADENNHNDSDIIASCRQEDKNNSGISSCRFCFNSKKRHKDDNGKEKKSNNRKTVSFERLLFLFIVVISMNIICNNNNKSHKTEDISEKRYYNDRMLWKEHHDRIEKREHHRAITKKERRVNKTKRKKIHKRSNNTSIINITKQQRLEKMMKHNVSKTKPYNQTAGTRMWKEYLREKTASTSLQPDVLVHGTLAKTYTELPKNVSKTVFIRTYSAAARYAFVEVHGWTEVDRCEDAHVCHVQRAVTRKLQPWQRASYIEGYYAFESKHTFVVGLRNYYFAQQKQRNWWSLSSSFEDMQSVLYFLPETYLLNDEKDQILFRSRLHHEGGMNRTWVLKDPFKCCGKGIEILGANSYPLETVIERINNETTTTTTTAAVRRELDYKRETKTKDTKTNSLNTNREENRNDYIIQQYICNELTWFQGQKFDLRFYWFVLSVDPPIVLFHDGFARVSQEQYQETDFSNTDIHLTNHKYRDDSDSNVTADILWKLIRQHHNNNHDSLSKITIDPVQHVRNQMKEAIGTFSKAFLSGNTKAFGDLMPDEHEIQAENFYGLYGCDFIIDNDLDVYFIEAQNHPGSGGKIPWRQQLNRQLYLPIPKLLEEITQKQETNPTANLLPLENLGAYEIVRAGDWHFTFNNYKRKNNQEKKACSSSTN